MPYVSDAQRKWAHTDAAKKAGFPTKEFDEASKGEKNLPEHVAKKKGKAKPGSKEHRAKHIGKAIKRAHKEYNDKYGEPQQSNPFNSQSY